MIYTLETIEMLTKRRQEILKVLRDLNEQKGPIGYEELALELGISKWSAYELLIQLEEEGYVLSELKRSEGKLGGRPSLRFRLSPQGEEILGGESHLQIMKEELSHYFQSARRDLSATISTLKEKIATATSPLTKSVRSLAMLLLELRRRSSPIFTRVREALRSGEDLPLISGAVMVGDREGRLSKIVRTCQRALSRLSKAQKELIASVLREEARKLEAEKEV